jgi:1-acyl-sn-glycerol-3-phosphate acyltransferase
MITSNGIHTACYLYVTVILFIIQCNIQYTQSFSSGFTGSSLRAHSSLRLQRALSTNSLLPHFNKQSLSQTALFRKKDAAIDPYEAMAQPVSNGLLHIKIKGKVLNLWGVFTAFVLTAFAVVVLPFMIIFAKLADVRGNGKRRRFLDWLIHWWAKMSLRVSLCQPTIYGLENLPPYDEVVVYVPNHTSFFDILLLSGFVPRPFKYLSKEEILKIPIVGLSMKLAKHVFLKRNNIRSTIEVADQCVQRLLDGNSMVLFAEGTRSQDGSLKKFKKGAFQFAKDAKVRVVPISIGNLHRWMPPSALLPLAPIRHTFITIHPPIETIDRKIKDIRNDCFEAVNSGLPKYQQYDKKALPQDPSIS